MLVLFPIGSVVPAAVPAPIGYDVPVDFALVIIDFAVAFKGRRIAGVRLLVLIIGQLGPIIEDLVPCAEGVFFLLGEQSIIDSLVIALLVGHAQVIQLGSACVAALAGACALSVGVNNDSRKLKFL